MHLLAIFQGWNFIGFLRVGAHEYSAVAHRTLGPALSNIRHILPVLLNPLECDRFLVCTIVFLILKLSCRKFFPLLHKSSRAWCNWSLKANPVSVPSNSCQRKVTRGFHSRVLSIAKLKYSRAKILYILCICKSQVKYLTFTHKKNRYISGHA